MIDVSQLSLQENLSEQIDQHLADLFHIKTSALDSITKLVVLNKIDLIKTKIDWKSHPNLIPISCLSDINIEEFLSKLIQSIADKYISFSLIISTDFFLYSDVRNHRFPLPI